MDYTLYFVTDRALAGGRAISDVVSAAVEGGVTAVQLREKRCTTRDFIDVAMSIRDYLFIHQIPLIINDRLDVAMAVNADGVHLGQSDMPITMARKIVKDGMLIGISTHNISEAKAAEKQGADYIGVGPVFATATKTDTEPVIGLPGIREIRKHVKLPIVAIGGLSASNASPVIENGANGIAVVSAIAGADCPKAAAQALRATIQEARR